VETGHSGVRLAYRSDNLTKFAAQRAERLLTLSKMMVPVQEIVVLLQPVVVSWRYQ
jgi:hypothetical protein